MLIESVAKDTVKYLKKIVVNQVRIVDDHLCRKSEEYICKTFD